MSSKQNSAIKSPKIPAADKLRIRVATLKTAFKKRCDYTALYIYEFGPQTEKQLMKIRAVWCLQRTDEEITKNLETIAKKNKA